VSPIPDGHRYFWQNLRGNFRTRMNPPPSYGVEMAGASPPTWCTHHNELATGVKVYMIEGSLKMYSVTHAVAHSKSGVRKHWVGRV